MQYDNTVRNSEALIVQFCYGYFKSIWRDFLNFYSGMTVSIHNSWKEPTGQLTSLGLRRISVP